MEQARNDTPKVVLITGAARRIGRMIAESIHAKGMNVIIHYNHSENEAQELVLRFNQIRPNSATMLQAELVDLEQVKQLGEQAIQRWGRLDVLINNASQFFSTPFPGVTAEQYHTLFQVNVAAPFALAQTVYPALEKTNGMIINITDSTETLPGYPIYNMTRAALNNMTETLSREFRLKRSSVSINTVSPGPTLPPEGASNQALVESTIALGDVQMVANAVIGLMTETPCPSGKRIMVGKKKFQPDDIAQNSAWSCTL